ncbi:Calcium/Calmodulin-Dependent 3',5'-Cyclic Nucleotide Phosphodiesterase 1A [Manis pentadactyla]|nr:Calcium/Calmodulin-Dependent 3',5'-Cyclic Nucleotide Phosphodiesterase 1A [Manis pentadactyla]
MMFGKQYELDLYGSNSNGLLVLLLLLHSGVASPPPVKYRFEATQRYTIKNGQVEETIGTALSDISNPDKSWRLHHRWTMAPMEEFFLQGDEAELELPFSPLSDRKSTLMAQSQIDFIDFIVEPTFSLLSDSTEKIIIPLLEEASKAETSSYGASRLSNKKGPMNNGTYFPDYSLESVDLKSFRNNLVDIIQQNRGGKN